MKVSIVYQKSRSELYPCQCNASADGPSGRQYQSEGIGRSFDEAKRDAIESLRRKLNNDFLMQQGIPESTVEDIDLN